ncbi:GAP family protein [Mycobacterium decipiens]|uniref:Gap protein n=1 Tax=Mycobacterium decipiens TaxID=1430326 RepID=A0A1X2LWI8_9MYCO|nr:GAP family protein [Mycobacterium decipiens]OSC41472.1 hypothetical protein B8W66_08855 [Mycobacterium decipiens]
MWSTVLVLALSVMCEPIRIGLVVLMLNRRRPLLQLLTFLCGGYTMGGGVGLVTLMVLKATPLAGHFSVPKVQITTGLIALLIALVLATDVVGKRVRRAPADARVKDDRGVVLLEPVPSRGAHKLALRARRFLQGDSLYVAGVSGAGAALPSANYMGALAAILASGAAPATQALAVLTFNVVAFTIAEVPLVSYLAAPQKTRAFMAGLQSWLRSRSRHNVALLVAVGGCFMLALGLSNV